MKKYLSTFFAVLLLISTGCRKTVNKPQPTPTNTLLQQIAGDSNLVILNAAIERAQLDTVFRGGGPYTIFAPVDSAFINAGLTIERIESLSPDSLRQLIGYHIIIGRISSDDIVGFVKQKFVSLNTIYRPFVIKNYYGIFLNGIHVDQPNILCADGVLHKIGRVSAPPQGDLYQTILQQPDLSILSAILQSNPVFPSPNYPYALESLAGLLHFAPDSLYYSENDDDEDDNHQYAKPLYSNFTFMAPNDAAFQAEGLTIDSVQYLIANNPQVLNNMIVFNFICGEYFTADFLPGFFINRYSFYADGDIPNTYSFYDPQPFPQIGISPDGRSVSYGIEAYADATTQISSAPRSLGRIVRPDVLATNGVIQVIDSLMDIHF